MERFCESCGKGVYCFFLHQGGSGTRAGRAVHRGGLPGGPQARPTLEPPMRWATLGIAASLKAGAGAREVEKKAE